MLVRHKEGDTKNNVLCVLSQNNLLITAIKYITGLSAQLTEPEILYEISNFTQMPEMPEMLFVVLVPALDIVVWLVWQVWM